MRGANGDIDAEQSETRNMKTLLATAALAAVIASPAFAQTGTRSRVQAAEHPSQYDQQVGRAEAQPRSAAKAPRSTTTTTISVLIPIQRAPRSAPRFRGPRLLIAAVTARAKSKAPGNPRGFVHCSDVISCPGRGAVRAPAKRCAADPGPSRRWCEYRRDLARHHVTARMLHRCRHGRTLMFADFACSLFAEIWEILFGLSCTGL